jgi:hypothetical protein
METCVLCGSLGILMGDGRCPICHLEGRSQYDKQLADLVSERDALQKACEEREGKVMNTRQKACALAIKHGLCHYAPGDDGYGGEYEADDNAIAALTEALAHRDALLNVCKAVDTYMENQRLYEDIEDCIVDFGEGADPDEIELRDLRRMIRNAILAAEKEKQ